MEGHNSLGWIGWHLTTAPAYFAGLVGLSVNVPGDNRGVPKQANQF